MTANATGTPELPQEPDVTVTLTRGMSGNEAVWHVRAEAHGVGYNNTEFESEIDSLMSWLGNTVTFLMGCVAADQRMGAEEQTAP
jgi:hypothetical protein